MTSQDSLGDCASKGEHSQTSILELGQAHLLLALLVAGEPAGKTVVTGDLQRIPFEDLLRAAELHEADPEQDLGVDTWRFPKIGLPSLGVPIIRIRVYLGYFWILGVPVFWEMPTCGTAEGFVSIDGDRHGLEGELLAGQADEVRDHQAEPGEHTDAAVLELCLTKPRDLLRFRREAQGIELVAAPGTLGTHQALRELAVVKEIDAGVLIGHGELAAS